MTQCSSEQLSFQGLGNLRVEGKFDCKKLSSDGGLMVFREVFERRDLFSRIASCFTDNRSPAHRKHEVKSLVEQRICGLLCGYEDLNDHDHLRHDPLFELLGCNKAKQGEGQPRASSSTLNRLELTPRAVSSQERYHKIVCNDEQLQELFLEEFVAYAKTNTPEVFIIDFDATDLPLHGKQQDGHYHGYYRHYCYLPLYAFCEGFPLWAALRPSNIDASLGTEAALEKIVTYIRSVFPDAQFLVRGDSGFCRESIMAYCEENNIDYLFGIARNKRLEEEIAPQMVAAQEEFNATGVAARVFKDFTYQTLKSWSQARRVVGKAEYLAKGANPRFVVTSLDAEQYAAAPLYETLYCMRSEAENRIKEQLQMFAGRTSCTVTRANQLRLWFSTFAYLIMHLAKKTILKHTEAASMEVTTLRAKLIKVAVQIKVSARRVYLSFAENFPFQNIFVKALSTAPT